MNAPRAVGRSSARDELREEGRDELLRKVEAEAGGEEKSPLVLTLVRRTWAVMDGDIAPDRDTVRTWVWVRDGGRAIDEESGGGRSPRTDCDRPARALVSRTKGDGIDGRVGRPRERCVAVREGEGGSSRLCAGRASWAAIGVSSGSERRTQEVGDRKPTSESSA